VFLWINYPLLEFQIDGGSKINPALIQTLSEMNQFESKLNQELHSMNQNPLEIQTFYNNVH
jgi:hypothetical protein